MSMWSFGMAERGATLIVALIMLLLFTLLVSGAFTLSTVNLKAVGNMQVREESLAAANMVVEQLVSLDFVGTGTQTFDVDINNDGTDNYQVQVAEPVCIRATVAEAAEPSSATLTTLSSDTWNTVWLIDVTASDPASGSGSNVKVRTGVRVLLTDAQKNVHCS